MTIWDSITVRDCLTTILAAREAGNDVSDWVWTAPDCPFRDGTFLGYRVVVDPKAKSIGFGPKTQGVGG
jgi:hypothetical protein